MASTGKKVKKNKGKTVPLNDFLSNTTISWSDQVDEADKLGEFNRKLTLPAAPRAAMAVELDESTIPKNPPYVAYVSNLSYELQDDDIINAFVGLNISNVRLPRDDRSGRLKGFGYVEFGDRDSFIAALLKHEVTIRGWRIKIDVAENEGERRRGGQREMRNRETNFESERSDWRSGGPKRSEFLANEDRRGLGSGRKDYGGFRDRDSYDRGGRSDRVDRSGESNWRDSERRYGGDRDNRGYGSRRNYNEPEISMEPKTRTKLNLKPRTKPIEEIVVKEDPSDKIEDRPVQEKPPSTSIFGQAKPVDTAAREREIEQRLEKEKEGLKSEKEFDKSKPKESEDDSSCEVKRPGPPESKENVWVRRSQRLETHDVTSRDSSTGKTNDLDEPDKVGEEEEEEGGEDEKKISENNEDSSHEGNKKIDDCESDHDNDNRYGRFNKNETRFNDRIQDGGDKSFGRDDKNLREKDKRDYDRRDRFYDSDRRMGNNGGRNRDRDGDSRRYDREGDSRRYDRDGDSRRYDRDGDSRRYDREGDFRRYDRDGDSRRYDRDGDSRRYDRDGDFRRYDRDGDSRRYDRDGERRFDKDGESRRYDRDGESKRYNDREGDWREPSDKEGDNKRVQDREIGRQREQDEHGANKGPRVDKRGGGLGSGDKGPRPVKITQDREKGPQTKERPKEQKKPEDGVKLPKFKESTAPNYINTNKYSFLDEDGVSE